MIVRCSSFCLLFVFRISYLKFIWIGGPHSIHVAARAGLCSASRVRAATQVCKATSTSSLALSSAELTPAVTASAAPAPSVRCHRHRRRRHRLQSVRQICRAISPTRAAPSFASRVMAPSTAHIANAGPVGSASRRPLLLLLLLQHSVLRTCKAILATRHARSSASPSARVSTALFASAKTVHFAKRLLPLQRVWARRQLTVGRYIRKKHTRRRSLRRV